MSEILLALTILGVFLVIVGAALFTPRENYIQKLMNDRWHEVK